MARFNGLRLRLMIGLAGVFFLLSAGLHFASPGDNMQTGFYSKLCLEAALILTVVLLSGFVPVRHQVFLNRPNPYQRLRFPIMAVCVIAIGYLLYLLFNSYFLPMTQVLNGISGE